MNEPKQLDVIDISALKYHMGIVEQAQKVLSEVVKLVLHRLGVPANWQIRIEPDGGMTAIAPPEPTPHDPAA